MKWLVLVILAASGQPLVGQVAVPIVPGEIAALRGIRNVAIAAETPSEHGSACGLDRGLLMSLPSKVLIDNGIALESEPQAVAVFFTTPLTVLVERADTCVTSLLFELISFEQEQLSFHAEPQLIRVELLQKGMVFSTPKSQHRGEAERVINRLVGEMAMALKRANP